MRHALRLSLVLPMLTAGAALACERQPSVPSTNASRPEAPANSAPSVVVRTEPRETELRPFHVAYARACGNSGWEPGIVSGDGKELFYCGRVFDYASGRFLRVGGPALALLSNGDALSWDLSRGGLRLGNGTSTRASTSRASDSSFGFGRDLVVDGTERYALTREEKSNEEFLVLRELPSLKTLRSLKLDGGAGRSVELAFLGGEPAIALGECRAPTPPEPRKARKKGTRASNDRRAKAPLSCTKAGVYRWGSAGLARMPAPIGDARGLSVSANGARAVIRDATGDRRLVDAGGRLIAALPRAGGTDSRGAGGDFELLDATGVRAGLTIGDEFLVIGIDDASRVHVLYRRQRTNGSEHAAFSRHGHGLVYSDHSSVWVLGESAPPTRSQPTYNVELPKGFRRPVHESVSTVSFSRSKGKGEDDGDGELKRFGHLARYQDDKQEIDVYVTASDRAEHMAGTLDEWRRQLLARESTYGYAGRGPSTRELKEGPSGRIFEFVYYQREGCEFSDNYVRYFERQDWLYRVEVSFPPGAKKKRVDPILAVFFHPADRERPALAFLKPPAWLKGPC